MISEPWYKIPQVWLIITFPSLAVIGGMITIWLAMSTSDGLVIDNYYREGLAINQTLDKDKQAESYQLFAQLSLVEGKKISMNLSGELTTLPPKLSISWLHPTRSGMDQNIILNQDDKGNYQGQLEHGLSGGNWYLQINQDDWRIKGRLHWPHSQQSVLAGFDNKRQ